MLLPEYQYSVINTVINTLKGRTVTLQHLHCTCCSAKYLALCLNLFPSVWQCDSVWSWYYSTSYLLFLCFLFSHKQARCFILWLVSVRSVQDWEPGVLNKLRHADREWGIFYNTLFNVKTSCVTPVKCNWEKLVTSCRNITAAWNSETHFVFTPLINENFGSGPDWQQSGEIARKNSCNHRPGPDVHDKADIFLKISNNQSGKSWV